MPASTTDKSPITAKLFCNTRTPMGEVSTCVLRQLQVRGHHVISHLEVLEIVVENVLVVGFFSA